MQANDLIQQAQTHEWRRPWDGHHGRDFQRWKMAHQYDGEDSDSDTDSDSDSEDEGGRGGKKRRKKKKGGGGLKLFNEGTHAFISCIFLRRKYIPPLLDVAPIRRGLRVPHSLGSQR